MHEPPNKPYQKYLKVVNFVADVKQVSGIRDSQGEFRTSEVETTSSALVIYFARQCGPVWIKRFFLSVLQTKKYVG